MKCMSKHIDYVQQPDGTYKWELAEIPAVKSTPPAKEEKKKPAAKKTTTTTTTTTTKE